MHGPKHKTLEDINIVIGWQLMHLDSLGSQNFDIANIGIKMLHNNIWNET